MDETRTFMQIRIYLYTYLYADCNNLSVQQRLLSHLLVYVFIYITNNKFTITYHTSISLYNIHFYMFRPIYVIVKELYFCALFSYINS